MNYQQICDQVIEICRGAGAFILEQQQQVDAEDIQLKGQNDLVSYVDQETEKKLVEALSFIVPEAGFIAEEGTAPGKKETYNWVIDPIDGTTNFLHDLPVFSISVALMKQEDVVVGVIYDPTRNEMFHTYEGAASFCNGQKIQISDVTDIAESLLATGFPYQSFQQMPSYLAILDELMKGTHGLRRMGSAAIDLAYVACGRFEGFFEFNLKPWDVAAGVLLVKNAGGHISDFSGGQEYIFGRELLAAGKTHDQILKVIQDHWR